MAEGSTSGTWFADPQLRPVSPPPNRSVQAKERPAQLRPGDHGYGSPNPTPARSEALSEAELAERARLEDERHRAEFEAQLADITASLDGWKLPRPLRRAMNAALLVVGALLGFVLLNQTLELMANLSTLPPVTFWTAVGVGGALSLAIIYVMALLGSAFLRLNRSPQVNVRALQIIKERQAMQRLASEKQSQAREAVANFLKNFPLADQRKPLMAAGLAEDAFPKMETARTRLLDDQRPISSDDWLQEFAGHFQGSIDVAAKTRIKNAAVRTGLFTAVTPYGLIDQAIVFSSALALVKDLMQLYQLRPAWGQSASILAKAIVITYISGSLDDATDNVGDLIGDRMGEIIGSTGGAILGKTGAKATEGTLNAFFIQRVGLSTMKMLQPVR